MIRWLRPVATNTRQRTLGLLGSEWDRPHLLAWGQTSFSNRMPTAVIEPAEGSQPLPIGPALDLAELRLHDPLFDRPIDAFSFLERRLFNDALLIMSRGRVVHESYRNGLHPSDLHVVHSVSKSLTTMMVGIAVGEGRLDPAAPIAHYVPALRALPAWAPVTLQHVLDMATGIDCDEDYLNPESMYWRYARAVGYAGDGEHAEGAMAFLIGNLTRRREAPGECFNYASYLTNLLPVALEHAYGVPALELYDERIYRHLGAEFECEINVDSQGLPIVEGQVNLTLRDLARWAALYLNGGRSLAAKMLIPNEWIEATIAPDEGRRAAFARAGADPANSEAQYGNQCWILDPQKRRFAFRGIHGQFAYFDLPAELMIVGMGSFPVQVAPLMRVCLDQLWAEVTRAVR